MKTYQTQPLDLMQFINTKYHDPFIHELLEFEDGLDPQKLIQAVDSLADVFPLLKCHYDQKRNIFIEKEHCSGSDLLRIVDTADRSVLLTEALDTDEKLVQLTLSKNTLVITISHMICDGSGFKQLIYLLCDLYNGNSNEKLDYLMTREFSQLTKELTGTTAITFKMLLSMMGNYKSRPVYAKASNESIYVVERTIPREIMSRVHSMAKKQGATLNDVFLTAYARALEKLYGLKKINIPCTVDLRKYAKAKTGIANLTGTYNLNIKMKDGTSFGETLAEASAVMRKQKKTQNDIAGPMLLVSKYEKSTLEQFLKLYGGMETSASADYTNLGVLDDKRLVFDGTALKNAIGYSGLNKAPSFQIAVSSFRGETTITSLVRCGKKEKEKVDLILDTIAREIESFS
ncbi:MAG: condensation domain-containing protein [Eubacteriales bacterium]